MMPDGAISIDPNIRFGRACIRGTRIAVADVLNWLAHGMSENEIVGDFPELTVSQIRACLSYAAEQEDRGRVPHAAE